MGLLIQLLEVFVDEELCGCNYFLPDPATGLCVTCDHEGEDHEEFGCEVFLSDGD